MDLLTRKRNLPPVAIKVGPREVVPSGAIKYLGVWLDGKLNFATHVTKTVEKAGKAATALGRVMANTYGPKSSKRRLLGSVVTSILLYAAPAWGRALEVRRTKERMIRTQRATALRICSAYRTASYEAVSVVSGSIPIELLARESTEVYEGADKREARERLWERWQEIWDRTEKGRWTRRLIGEVRPWVQRRYGEVGYYLTQVLTGHGCFVEYLFDIGKAGSRECLYCGENDDTEHTVFHCNRWGGQRRESEERLGGRLTPENLVGWMLENERKWGIVEELVTSIMKTKEQDEREWDLNP